MDSAPPDRHEALRALTDCIREFDQVATKLHATALWVLESYADAGDPEVVEMTETVRMLPIGIPRPGKPAVPPAPGIYADILDPDHTRRSVTRDGTTEVGCPCGCPESDHDDLSGYCGRPRHVCGEAP